MYRYDKKTKKNMIIFQKKRIEKHNPNWTRILDHPYIILIMWGSRTGEINTLLNLIKQQYDDYNIIDKIYIFKLKIN